MIAKSNVPPIANFIDGIFTVERSAMTAGFSVRGSPVINIQEECNESNPAPIEA